MATIDVIPAEVVEYLRVHHIITLSTASFTGMPHANTVAYANDDTQIFFTARGDSNVSQNVAVNHYVSFTIDDYTTDWRKVRELQGVGRCFPADLDETQRAFALYTGKFGQPLTEASGTLFAVRPHEMHFVDYTYARVVPLRHAVGPGDQPPPILLRRQRRTARTRRGVHRSGPPCVRTWRDHLPTG